MKTGGKTSSQGREEAFGFSLGSKKKLQSRKREIALAHCENLRNDFHQLRGKIDWDMLRRAATENEIDTALSRLSELERERLPRSAAILATVQDRDYPKVRPIRFLAESCALSMQAILKSGNRYSPRYSRDICYDERKRRGPIEKPVSNLEFWVGQDELGQPVPVRFLRRINKLRAKERKARRSPTERILTYVDIPETIGSVKKKRTTVWLPETTVAKLRDLSIASGAPMAELFRRAVEAFLKKVQDNNGPADC